MTSYDSSLLYHFKYNKIQVLRLQIQVNLQITVMGATILVTEVNFDRSPDTDYFKFTITLSMLKPENWHISSHKPINQLSNY